LAWWLKNLSNSLMRVLEVIRESSTASPPQSHAGGMDRVRNWFKNIMLTAHLRPNTPQSAECLENLNLCSHFRTGAVWTTFGGLFNPYFHAHAPHGGPA
jgi:hypothetical protein